MAPNIPLDRLSVPEPLQPRPHTKVSSPVVSAYIQWLETVFAPGTVIKVVRDGAGDLDYIRGDIPLDTRMEVTPDPDGGGRFWALAQARWFVHAKILDARDPVTGRQLPMVGSSRWVHITAIEPMEDNWLAKRRTSRHIPHHRLPASQRTRWMKPNIPVDRLSVPVPWDRPDAYGGPGWKLRRRKWSTWLRQTFAPGTPVKLVQSFVAELSTSQLMEMYRDEPADYGDERDDDFMVETIRLPEGTRAEVARLPFPARGYNWQVPVRILDARDASGLQVPLAIGLEVSVPWSLLEPLVDNHASRQPSYVPRSQRSPRSWLKP